MKSVLSLPFIFFFITWCTTLLYYCFHDDRTFVVVAAAQHQEQQETRLFDCTIGCSFDPIISGDIVCGMDDITYANECIAICQGVTIQKYEPCNDNNEFKPNRRRLVSKISRKVGTISLLTMIRYHHEGFKFVGQIDMDNLDDNIDSPADLMMIKNSNTDTNSTNEEPDMNNTIYRSLRITYEGYEYEGIVNMTLYSQYKHIIQTAGYDPTSKKTKKMRGTRQLKKEEEGIIGEDNRTKIKNTKLYPYRTIGNIGYGKNCDGCCTGTVISNNAVLTAAHCLYNTDTQRFYRSHKDIAPGQTKRWDSFQKKKVVYEPFGRWEFETATILTTYSYNWRYWQWDYGVATYRKNKNKKFIGDVVGTIGISEMMNANSSIVDNSIVIGYPSKFFNEMYSSGNCSIGFWSPINDTIPYEIRTDCDTGPGTSGSSIINIIQTKKHKMSQSRGVMSYVNESDIINKGQNGGCGFIHGGPHVPSIIQWANLTIIK